MVATTQTIRQNGAGWSVLGPNGDVVSSLERESYRARAKARRKLLHRSAYKSASGDRGYGDDWIVSANSADADLLPDLEVLKFRSRERLRNDPVIGGMNNALSRNVIGTGIRCQANVDAEGLGIPESRARAINTWLDKAWAQWIQECDYCGNRARRGNFYNLQTLAYTTKISDGQFVVFPRWERRPGYRFMSGLQLVEADRIYTPPGLSNGKAENGNQIRNGVEIDALGREVAIYLADQHPGEYGVGWHHRTGFQRIPALTQYGTPVYRRCFDMTRIGLTHGVPLLTGALGMARHLSGYIGAELTRAEMAAMFGLIFTQSDKDTEGQFGYAGLDISNEDRTADELALIANAHLEFFEPGMVHYGAPGEDVKTVSGNVPNPNADAFAKLMASLMGAPIGLVRELVLGTFDDSNFSQSRLALGESRRGFAIAQLNFIAQFVEPARELFMTEVWLRGWLESEFGRLPDFFTNKEAYLSADIQAPGWPYMEPVKDIKADIDGIAANITTIRESCSKRGLNYKDVLRQRAQEKAFMEELGLDAADVAEAMRAPAQDDEDEGDPEQ